MNVIRILNLLSLAFLLVACSSVDREKAEYFEQAKQWYQAGEFEKAGDAYRKILELDPGELRARFHLAQTLEKLQDFNGAASQYHAILEQDETHVRSRIRLGQFLMLAGKYDQAMEYAETAIKHAPDNADVLAFRGSVFLKQNNPESAMRDAIRALESDPDNVNAILLKAGLLSRNGNTEGSIDLLKSGLEKHPDNALLRNTLASVYIHIGDYNRAIEQIKLLSEQQPGVLYHRLRLADIYYATDQKQLAAETLHQAVRDFPENNQAMLSLVKYLTREEGNDAAVAQMQKFIREQPENYVLQFTLAKLYQGLGQSDDAVTIYKDVISKEALKPNGLNARIHLAELYAKTGRNTEARTLLAEVLEKAPDNRTALALRGQVALSEGDAVSAIADFKSAMKDQPDSASLLRNLARAYMANNELDLAADTLNRAINLKSTDLGLREELVRVLALKGDTEGVIRELDRVLEISPDNLKAMEAMFRVQAARKDWDALTSITEQMKQAHPDKAIGYYYAGMLLREQGKVEESIGEFERAVELSPGAIEPLTQLVRTHVSLEQPDRALEILDGILANNADNVFAQNLKGEMYLFKQEYDKAVEAFETAISMQPQWQLPYRNLANTYLLMKENEKAIGAYERGIDATGFSPLLVTDLARYFEISGNVDKAISLYEEVLVQDENNNLASNNLAMLLIDYRGDEQSLQRASVLVENLKDINNAAYQDTIGWLLYKQNRIEEAIPHLEKAVAASPENVGLNYHLGMAYYKSGNKEGARKALTIATSTDQKYLGIEDARKALESL